MSNPSQREIEQLIASGQFNADWYLNTYPDVAISGIEPERHYLKYGYRMQRNPSNGFNTRFIKLAYGMKDEHEPITRLEWMRRKSGQALPNKNRILLAANEVAKTGNYQLAIALAEEYLPPDLAYTAHILRANAAITAGDEANWLHHLNAYLANFDVAPIRLEGEGTIFDRFACADLPLITDGPLISVIMPAWNADKTVRMAAKSILNQTWRNLELLIVDDCSTDRTWEILQDLARKDCRVRIMRNKVNVGPYVSKNMALSQARGEWITGHDSDDWAHPQRLEQHMMALYQYAQPPRVSVTNMVRLDVTGRFDTISGMSSFSFDGVTRLSSISALFDRKFLSQEIGFWDSVRFGADSEIISRVRHMIGNEFQEFRKIGMLCASLPESLTNNQTHGVRANNGRLSDARAKYKESWTSIHATHTSEELFLSFPQETRRYEATEEMIVPVEDIIMNVKDYQYV